VREFFGEEPANEREKILLKEEGLHLPYLRGEAEKG